MHVMGWRQCSFSERMILGMLAVNAMVSIVIVIVKQALTMMEIATCWTTKALVYTNTSHPVSANFKVHCLFN